MGRSSIGAIVVVVCASSAADASPQLIQYGSEGIRVGEQVIVEGAVDSAAFDGYRDRLYYVRKKTLYVLDLNEDEAKPVAIAKNMPRGPWSMDGAGYGWAEAGPYPYIDADGHVSVAEGPNTGYAKKADKKARAAARKVKVVGKKWLKKHRHDETRRYPYAEPSSPYYWSESHPPLFGFDACDVGYCGEAQTVPGHKDQFIELIGATCDAGGCHARCLFHTYAWASPIETGQWSDDGTTLTPGPCYGYLWLPDGTYAIGEHVCAYGDSAVACQDTPGWTAVAWVNVPIGAEPTVAEWLGIDGVAITMIDRTDPERGVPAIAADLGKVVLPYRVHDGGGATYDFAWCTLGVLDCPRRETLGHGDSDGRTLDGASAYELSRGTYLPMPYWTYQDGATSLRTDYGLFRFERTKTTLKVGLTDWDGTDYGKATLEVDADTRLEGVAIAPGTTAYLYIRVSVPNGSERDDRWDVWELSVQP